MKKMLALIVCVFSIASLHAWDDFLIKNDTSNTITFEYQDIQGTYKTQSVEAGKTLYVKNPNGTLKMSMQGNYNILVKEGETEFKIAETVAPQDRTFTVASVVIIDKGADYKILNASELFSHATLPNGYKYKEYATGLLLHDENKITETPIGISPVAEARKELIKNLITGKTVNPIKFNIENDTNFVVKVVSADGLDKKLISTIDQNTQNKISNIFTVNPISYKNYKLPAGSVGMPRFKYVDEDNCLKLEIEINKNIYNFTVVINPEIQENSIFKISNIIGFTAISDK